MKRRRILNRSHCLKANVYQCQWCKYSNSPRMLTRNNSKLIADLYRGLWTGYNFLCYNYTVYLTSLSHLTGSRSCTHRIHLFLLSILYLSVHFQVNEICCWSLFCLEIVLNEESDINGVSPWRKNEKPQTYKKLQCVNHVLMVYTLSRLLYYLKHLGEPCGGQCCIMVKWQVAFYHFMTIISL